MMTEREAASGKPLISVIVPVYNVEEYVLECLESISAQTFADFECIVVDDGSTDDSSRIVDEYAATDPRFKVIHQANRGLSGARNVGIDVARGEYLSFIDSDDFIHPEMLEKLLSAIEDSGASIAMCDLDYVLDGSHVPARLLDGVEDSLLEERRFWSLACSNITISSVAMTNKLWKRTIFSQARFEEGRISEDIIILPDVIPGNVPIALVKERLYYYRMRMGSLSRRMGSITVDGTRAFDTLYVLQKRLDWDPYFAAHGWTDVRVKSLRYIVSHLASLYEREGIPSDENLRYYAEVRKQAKALFIHLLPALLMRPAVAIRVIPYFIDERFHNLLFNARARIAGR